MFFIGGLIMNSCKFLVLPFLSVALVGFALGIYFVFEGEPLAKDILLASARFAGVSACLFGRHRHLSKDSSKDS